MELNAGELVNRGVACWESGDLDQAIELYTEAISIDPILSIDYYNRGIAQGDKGNHDAAIADCNRILELKPRRVSLADVHTTADSPVAGKGSTNWTQSAFFHKYM